MLTPMQTIMRIQTSRLSTLAFSILFLSCSVNATDAVSPAFDCQKAKSQVEVLICQDNQLAKLDMQINATYQKVINQISSEEIANVKAFQRGWIKGRDDCWKAEQIKQCVQSSYETRLTELQIAAGEFEVPEPIQYECGLEANDTLTKVTAYFYNDTAIPAAMLTVSPTSDYINATNLALLTRTASGAKYQGQNFSFWTHQGEATLSQYAQADLNCKSH